MPTITNDRKTLHCYRAYDRANDRTSFIYQSDLAGAQAYYQRQYGVDPETVEWRDEGEVSEEDS